MNYKPKLRFRDAPRQLMRYRMTFRGVRAPERASREPTAHDRCLATIAPACSFVTLGSNAGREATQRELPGGMKGLLQHLPDGDTARPRPARPDSTRPPVIERRHIPNTAHASRRTCGTVPALRCQPDHCGAHAALKGAEEAPYLARVADRSTPAAPAYAVNRRL